MNTQIGGKCRVLLVGSEQERAEFEHSEVFAEQGLEIADEVSDVEEALIKLSQVDFDIIFTGSSIAIHDSLKIARYAKEKASLWKTTVISRQEITAEPQTALKSSGALNNDSNNPVEGEKLSPRKLVLQRLLRNNFEDRHEFLSSAEKIGIQCSERSCVLVAVFSHSSDKEEAFSNNEYERLEKAFNEAMKEYSPVNEENAEHISLLMNNRFVVMTQYSRIDAVIEALSSVCEELAIDYQIGIGSTFEQMEYIPISYREAHEAIIRCKSGQKVNNYIPETKKENDELRRLSEVNRTIIHALESGMHNEIPDIVDTFFIDLVNCAPDIALNMCINSVNSILGYFGINEMEKFKIKYRFDLVGPSIKEIYNAIKATYYDNILRIIQIMKNTPGGLAENTIKKAQDIVQRDYSKPDLSLCSISETLNISYCYLSKVFKQKTGSSFVNYLASVRMMNAKRLLLEGSLRINEVSNAVGYSSSAYFITAFKKFFETSPGDYKNRISGGEQQMEAKNGRVRRQEKEQNIHA